MFVAYIGNTCDIHMYILLQNLINMVSLSELTLCVKNQWKNKKKQSSCIASNFPKIVDMNPCVHYNLKVFREFLSVNNPKSLITLNYEIIHKLSILCFRFLGPVLQQAKLSKISITKRLIDWIDMNNQRKLN